MIQAVIYIFDGEIIPKTLVDTIGMRIGDTCKSMGVHAAVYSEKDIEDGLVRNETRTYTAPEPHEERTPADEAIIYIGTIFKNVLKSGTYSVVAFVQAVTSKLKKCRMQGDTEDSRKFMNALFILSREDLVVSKSILKKYNMDEEKIKLLKNFYYMVASN